MTATHNRPAAPTKQKLCIDLPGESVRCWRSSDYLEIVLRKHRDVFFEINLKPGTMYVVESRMDFYFPRDKKLVRKVEFQDGERLHLWVGREFRGSFVLKNGKSIIGDFKVSALDSEKYDADPKVKPEPLMIILGHKEIQASIFHESDYLHGAQFSRNAFDPKYDPKVAILKDYGTQYDYSCKKDDPEIKEYVCVTEAASSDLQEKVLKHLDSGIAVDGKVSEIFYFPTQEKRSSGLYQALAFAIKTISGNELLTSNWFKEAAGYTQEHWRALDKVLMRVRIEKKVNGKYQALFKGKFLSNVAAYMIGAGAQAQVAHRRAPLGSSKSAFLDGGFSRTGRDGYGGRKRIVLTSADNFRGGMKIQIIGTVIDIIGDVNDVYFKDEGSKDLSEFIARAGVSIVKAGATAVLGSVFAAFAVAAASTFFVAGLPVVIGVLIVVAGFMIAASIVDAVDNQFSVKTTVAEWAR